MNLKAFMTSLFASLAVLILCGTITELKGQGSKNAGVDIQGQIKGWNNQDIILGYYFGDNTYVKDTIKTDAKGMYRYQKSTELDEGIYLLIFKDKGYLEFIAPQGAQKFSIFSDTLNLTEKAEIKGSPQNQVFYDFLKFTAAKGKEIGRLREQLLDSNFAGDPGRIRAQMGEKEEEIQAKRREIAQKYPHYVIGRLYAAMPEPDAPELFKENGEVDTLGRFLWYREHFLDNVNLSDPAMLRSPVYHSKIKKYLEQMYLPIPDSQAVGADVLVKKASGDSLTRRYVIQFVTNKAAKSNVMGMEALYVHMVNKYYTPEQAWWLDSADLWRMQERAMRMEPTLLGKKAPDYVLQDTSGKKVRLLASNSPYLILYFYDVDCGHCKKATPVLKEFYEAYRSKGVEVVTFYTEHLLDKWKEYILEKNLNWINLADPEYETDIKYVFDIQATPSIFILDQERRFIGKKLAVEQLPEFMDRVLSRESN